jgi:hypothetical protein
MNSDDEVITLLIGEIDEYWEHFEHFPLYQLTWAQDRGFEPATQQMIVRAQRALDAFRADHPSRVVWSRWPIDLEGAWPVEPDATLEFDLDPEAPASGPLMILVPDAPATTS